MEESSGVGIGGRLLRLFYHSVVFGAVGAIGFVIFLLKTRLPQKISRLPEAVESPAESDATLIEAKKPVELEGKVVDTAKLLATEAMEKRREIQPEGKSEEEEEEEEEDEGVGEDLGSRPRHRQIIREVTVRKATAEDPRKEAARQMVTSAISKRQQHQTEAE